MDSFTKMVKTVRGSGKMSPCVLREEALRSVDMMNWILLVMLLCERGRQRGRMCPRDRAMGKTEEER